MSAAAILKKNGAPKVVRRLIITEEPLFVEDEIIKKLHKSNCWLLVMFDLCVWAVLFGLLPSIRLYVTALWVI